MAIQELRQKRYKLDDILCFANKYVSISRSSFYYNIKILQGDSNDRWTNVKDKIRSIYSKHKGRYGYRRITLQLRNEGLVVNHKTVRKLMIELGLKATRMKAAKYRSYKGKVGKVAPNVLNRCFNAIEPNRKWSTDITEVKIKGKKLYISTILDMFNGEIVTYTMSDHPDLRLVTSMVRQAFKKIVEFDNLIFHSDQGWHYQHQTYQKMLNERGVVQSMSRKGNCLDNSMMENFFGLMKTELLYLQDWDSIEQFKQELKNYIYYYNHERIKIRLDGMSPVKYRIKWMDQ